MVLEKVRSIDEVSDGWPAEVRTTLTAEDQSNFIEIRGVGTPYWQRSIFVPDHLQPIDIVENYPHHLPFPMFCSGVPTLSKTKVEFITSALVEPVLRSETMCSFTVARYQRISVRFPEIARGGLCDNPEDYVDENVLLSGNHCFVAFLLCGLPPSELQPIRINLARHRVERVYPWWMVSWED